MGRTIVGGVAFAVFAGLSCAAAVAASSVAESADSRPGWDACLKTPTRACVLDEALSQVLSYQPAPDRPPPLEPAEVRALRAAPLETIAEAHANAGSIEAALRVAGLIPPDHPALVTALRVIAGAQAKLGLENEAKQTFVSVDLLADSLEDALGHAEALQAIAKAEAEAGMATEAGGDLRKALALAARFEIPAGLCIIVPSPEDRLESLLRSLAEQQAKAGDVSGSLTTARSIQYHPQMRTEALVAIATIRSQGGHQSEAGAILKEALAAAASSRTPPELWPSCRSVRHLADSGGLYIELLGKVAKAQAQAGLIDDATLTLETALQFVPTIKDSSIQTADLAKSLALSEIALAQNEAGLRSQSAATLERAAQAASQVNDSKFPLLALIKLGRAQAKTGQITEATATFDSTEALALALPAAAQRALNLLDLFNARVEAGLAVETDATLARSLQAARSIPEKSKPSFLLRRIAQAQEKQGRMQDAVATYQEVLEAVAATDAQGPRANALFNAIRRVPGLVGDPRNLIAETAPQALQIAQSIADGLRRAEALVIIAQALPN